MIWAGLSIFFRPFVEVGRVFGTVFVLLVLVA